MSKKYELIEIDPKFINDLHGLNLEKVYHIRALIDIDWCNVKAGDFGGFVCSEQNLSQDGGCWVADVAVVIEHAQVSGDAFVNNHAIISGHASIEDNVIVTGNSKVGDHAIVRDHAWVLKHSTVCNNAIVQHNTRIDDWAIIRGNSIILDYAQIGKQAIVEGYANVGGNVCIHDEAIICDYAVVGHTVTMRGSSQIRGNAKVVANIELDEYAIIAGGNYQLTDHCRVDANAFVTSEDKIVNLFDIYHYNLCKDPGPKVNLCCFWANNCVWATIAGHNGYSGPLHKLIDWCKAKCWLQEDIDYLAANVDRIVSMFDMKKDVSNGR